MARAKVLLAAVVAVVAQYRGPVLTTGAGECLYSAYSEASSEASPTLACAYSEASPRLTATIAGILGSQGPVDGVTGDGGPAIEARLRTPRSLSVDVARRVLYVVEKQNHAVRRVDLEYGGLSTLAGVLGSYGRVGDKGFPTLSELNQPLGVAVDPTTHQVYIADTGNHVIRRLDVASGDLITVAGMLGNGGSTGAIWSSGDNKKKSSGGSNVEPLAATLAQLRFPHGVAVDTMKRQLYIADTYNHAVRAVNLHTGIISTVAGELGYGGRRTGDSGLATVSQLYFPNDITIDPVAQQLFIADTNNHVVRMVDLMTGILSTVAGVLGSPGLQFDNGPATSAELHLPAGVDVDWAARQLYIADTNNHAIRQYDIATGRLRTVAGTLGVLGFMSERESATSAQLYLPTGVAVDARPEARSLYVADSNNHVVRKVELESFALTTTAGILGKHGFHDNANDNATSATATELHHPRDVVVDSLKNQLYFADTSNHAIRRVDLRTGTISTVAGSLGRSGNTYNSTVTGSLAHGRSGNTHTQLLPAPSASTVAGSLDLPYGLAVDPEGRRLYIADTNNHAVRLLELPDSDRMPGGAPPSLFTIVGKLGMAGATGDMGQATSALLQSPYGVAVDPAGQRLFISDTGNHAVRLLNLSSGVLSGLAGVPGKFGQEGDGGLATAALLHLPYGIDFDASAQLVFLADCNNHAVRAVDLMTGKLSTVAGILASYGNVGDGEPATSAQLYFPFGVAVDSRARQLFIADNWNHAIRLLNLVTGTLTTVAGTLGVYGRKGDGGRATWAQLHSPMGLAVDSMRRQVYIADASNHAIRRLAVANDVRIVAKSALPGAPTSTTTTARASWMTNFTNDSVAVVSFVVQNVDYNSLAANSTLLSAFAISVKESVAREAGDGISPEHVSVMVSAGSVMVMATIIPPSTVSAFAVLSILFASKTLSDSIVAGLQNVPGIVAITSGSIAVSAVAVTSKVIEVMETIADAVTTSLPDTTSTSSNMTNTSTTSTQPMMPPTLQDLSRARMKNMTNDSGNISTAAPK